MKRRCASLLGERQAQFTDGALPPDDTKYANRNADLPHQRRRYVMKKFIAAIALFTIIVIPALSTSVNAATVSPSSSEFGSNGY
jgi:hypothetical protein